MLDYMYREMRQYLQSLRSRIPKRVAEGMMDYLLAQTDHTSPQTNIDIAKLADSPTKSTLNIHAEESLVTPKRNVT